MSQPTQPPSELSRMLLPLVVGVTGHRDLRKEDEPILKEAVARIFDDLAETYQSTPLVLLSPLAEGADRLAADVAVHWREKPRGDAEERRTIRLIVPLPMRQEYYEKDFPEEVDQFRSLLGQSGFHFSLTSADEPEATGAARDEQYAEVGTYVARHCQILIALWDGEPTDKVGGTAQVVRYKLTGQLNRAINGCALEQPETGPVYHILTPRRSHPFELTDPPTVRKYYPVVNPDGDLEPRTDAASVDSYTKVYKHTDEYNSDARRLGPRLLTHNPFPLFPEPEYPLSRGASRDLARYTLADALAVYYQTRAREALLALLWFAMSAALMFYLQHYVDYLYRRVDREAQTEIIIPGLGLKIDFLSLLYLIVLAIACTAYWWEKRARFHRKYLDYRALAEGLRVQFFWRLAGLHVSVAEHYLHKQKGELDWIRLALRVGSFPERPDDPEIGPKPGLPGLRMVLKHWVEHQLSFFRRTAEKNDRASRKFRFFERLAFLIGIVFSVLKVFLSYDNPSIILMVLFLFAAALLSIYVKILAFSEHAKQYAWMSVIFARARNCLRRLVSEEPNAAGINEPDRLKQARKLVFDLGREALAENGDWVLLHRERPLELPVK